MNHFVLGASIPFMIGVVFYALRGFRARYSFLIALPLTMSAVGLWAVIPDIPRFLGMQTLYYRLSHDPRCNIFLWHYSIDAIERESVLPSVFFIVLLIALLAIAVRELTLTEREKL